MPSTHYWASAGLWTFVAAQNTSLRRLILQLQEYFTKSAGPVKKVLLTYNKTGRSVGVVTIIFSQAHSAAKAAKDLDGVKVDGKPMKVCFAFDEKSAPGEECTNMTIRLRSSLVPSTLLPRLHPSPSATASSKLNCA
jgi:hypothetical protein